MLEKSSNIYNENIDDSAFVEWLIKQDYIIENKKELSPEEEDILYQKFVNRFNYIHGKYYYKTIRSSIR